MSREKKAEQIAELKDTILKCSVGILTDYRGLSAADITTLRRRLGDAGVEYKVVKNTLARFAAEEASRGDLAPSFVGPVAVAFGYGDVIEPAKVIAKFAADMRLEVAVKGGFLPERMLTAADVKALAKMPPREVLLAMVVGGINSPLTRLAGCLNAPISGLARVLGARIKQLEEA